MATGPKTVEEIPGWRFVRWEYDGAPLTAVRIARHSRDDAYEVEIDSAGDLVIDGLEGSRPCIPPEVMRRLVRDAKEREAPGWGAWSEE